MTTRFSPAPSVLSLLTLASALAVPLGAQTSLRVKIDDKLYAVRQVREGRPYVIKEDGRLTAVDSDVCVFTPVPEFMPAFISVRNIDAGSKYINSITVIQLGTGGTGSPAGVGGLGGMTGKVGSDINNTFHFIATFESPYRLKNVFFALEMEAEEAGSIIVYHEVGDLEPGQPRPVSMYLRLKWKVGAGRYKLHLYSDGAEVFNSQQSWQYREGMLDQMVARRIEGVRNSLPKALFGPAPEYPEPLRKAGVKGKAVVVLRITPRGAVTDPVVESATDPAFGEAALAAVRMWRFLPKIVDGVPVETKASVPFDF